MLRQFTALTRPSPLPPATAMRAIPERTDARARSSFRAAHAAQRSKRPPQETAYSAALRARLGNEGDEQRAKRRRRRGFTSPAEDGSGNWVGVRGRPPKRGVSAWPWVRRRPKGVRGEKISLGDSLQAIAPAQTFAETLTASEIANHIIRQQMNRLFILDPLQPLLVDGQMFQRVAETQEIGIALTHGLIHFASFGPLPYHAKGRLQAACQICFGHRPSRRKFCLRLRFRLGNGFCDGYRTREGVAKFTRCPRDEV